MFLNIIDLMLCIVTLATSILLALSLQGNHELGTPYIAAIVAYILLIDGTGFATCVISVVRAIGISSPFYRIKGKLLVIVGVMVFILLEIIGVVVSIFISSDMLVIARMAITGLIVLVVFTTTLISVCKLCRAGKDLNASGKDNSRKASWTVIIISAVFSFLNFIFLAGIVILFLGEPIIAVFSLFFAIPLNSAVNPIIYLTRRKDMRQFYSCCK